MSGEMEIQAKEIPEELQREIPEEVQREILSWLPSKSLSRFNCVSKQWLYSFTSSAFLLRHSRSPIPTNLFFSSIYLIESPPFDPLQTTRTIYELLRDLNESDEDDEEEEEEEEEEDTSFPVSYHINKGFRISLSNLPPLYHEHDDVCVSNFCDGLLCVFVERENLHYLSMLLYSVRTHEFVLLPTKSVAEMCKNAESEYVSDARRMSMCCLGFDPIRKEYKAFRVISGDDGVNEFEILTIGSSKYWSRLKDYDVIVPDSLVKGDPYDGSFCLDGVVYWANKFIRDRYVIGSFDLNRQVFRAFELDEVVGSSYNYCKTKWYLTSCNGRPTLICADTEDDREAVVLSLDQQNGVWTRTFEIQTPKLGEYTFLPEYQYVGGKIMVRRVGSFLSCYDIESGNQWFIKVVDGFQDDQVVKIGNCYKEYFGFSV